MRPLLPSCQQDITGERQQHGETAVTGLGHSRNWSGEASQDKGTRDGMCGGGGAKKKMKEKTSGCMAEQG